MKSSWYANQVVLHSVGFENALSWPQITPYLALYLDEPTATEPGEEPTNGNYARVPIAGAFSTEFITPGQLQNIQVITLPTPSADWGTIVAAGIHTAAEDGEFVRAAFAATSVAATNGVPLAIPVGGLLVQEV